MLAQQQKIQLSTYSDLYNLIVPKDRKKNYSTNQTDTYFFDVEKCKTCALKNGCYKPASETKSYSVSLKSDEHQEQMKFQQTDYFKEKAKHRYKIEAKNSELKNIHGYGRASSYGIDSMQMQGAMAIFTENLKKDLQIIELTQVPILKNLKAPQIRSPEGL